MSTSRTFKNRIKRIITAPFRLLGALLRGVWAMIRFGFETIGDILDIFLP